MMRLPKTVPMPAPEPATPTVAAPAPMNLAAVSMSRRAALVWKARWAPGRACGTQGWASEWEGASVSPLRAPHGRPGQPRSEQGARSLPCAPPRAGARTPRPPSAPQSELGALPAPSGPRGCSARRQRGAGTAPASSSSPARHSHPQIWGGTPHWGSETPPGGSPEVTSGTPQTHSAPRGTPEAGSTQLGEPVPAPGTEAELPGAPRPCHQHPTAAGVGVRILRAARAGTVLLPALHPPPRG